MDRPEITILAVIFCAILALSRLPGIVRPARLKAFLIYYASLPDWVVRAIGVLFLALSALIIYLSLRTVPLAALVVLAGGVFLFVSGALHIHAGALKKIVGTVEGLSPLAIRLLSLASLAPAVAIGVYLIMKG